MCANQKVPGELSTLVCWTSSPVFSVGKSGDKFENDGSGQDASTKWKHVVSFLPWLALTVSHWISQASRKKLWLTDTLCYCSNILRHPLSPFPFFRLLQQFMTRPLLNNKTVVTNFNDKSETRLTLLGFLCIYLAQVNWSSCSVLSVVICLLYKVLNIHLINNKHSFTLSTLYPILSILA